MGSWSNTGFTRKIATIFKDLSRTTFNFEGPTTRNVISHIAKKCTFSVHSNKTIKLELFPSPPSPYFSVHLSQFNSWFLYKTKNTLHKSLWTSLSYDLYFVLENQKALRNTFQATTFNVEENSRTFQGLSLKFKDYSRLCELCNR